MPRFHAILVEPARYEDGPEIFGDSLYDVKAWGWRVLGGATEEAYVQVYEKKEVLIDTLRKGGA
jgi:hypothetical protein